MARLRLGEKAKKEKRPISMRTGKAIDSNGKAIPPPPPASHKSKRVTAEELAEIRRVANATRAAGVDIPAAPKEK